MDKKVKIDKLIKELNTPIDTLFQKKVENHPLVEGAFAKISELKSIHDTFEVLTESFSEETKYIVISSTSNVETFNNDKNINNVYFIYSEDGNSKVYGEFALYYNSKDYQDYLFDTIQEAEKVLEKNNIDARIESIKVLKKD